MKSEPLPEPSVGDRLRKRRRALQKTLEQVAHEAGITAGYLSQLERGIATGSVGTLQRICAAIQLNVGDLFQGSTTASTPVLRYEDANMIHFGENASKVKLTPSQFDHLEMLLGVLEPGGSTGAEPYTHGASEEVLLVIEGEVEVTIEEQTHRLGPLDSVHYNSGQPHKIAEATHERPARVLWTMAPPTY
ncbi:cupin domain-containing protein [Saccharopolyspora sp. NPDC050389]|uniref:helix-turn-helix domain-containing protein n=1 Tax=Saccharopolyspora sp. NPDC050389 TaxID=3155516 RepID=UPI0033FC0482